MPLRKTGWRIPAFVGLSLLVHAQLALVLALLGVHWWVVPHPEGVGDGQLMDVTLIEPLPLNPLERPRSDDEEKALETKLVEPEKKDDTERQVVEITPPRFAALPPEKTDYAAEYDSRAAKETKARDLGIPGAHRIVIPGGETPVHNERERAAKEAKKEPGSLAMRGSSSGGGGDTQPMTSGERDGLDRTTGDDQALPQRGDPSDQRKADEAGEGPAGEEGQGGSGELPDVDSLRPTEQVLARVINEGSSDYLPDVDEGEETLLNTKRFKYAGFMNRVKRAVEQTWDPNSAYRLRDPTGQKYGVKNRHTMLKVSLKPDGRIRDLILEKSCGVDFLDEEALSAMREAEPFPNPPSGMIDPDSNLITFRFHFFFEVGERPSFRIFRYSN